LVIFVEDLRHITVFKLTIPEITDFKLLDKRINQTRIKDYRPIHSLNGRFFYSPNNFRLIYLSKRREGNLINNAVRKNTTFEGRVPNKMNCAVVK